MPEHYARRMTIEQRLAEIIGAFCLDALSSAVNLNVDLDVVLCVLAQALTAAFRLRLPDNYDTATPDTLQRRFLDTPGEIINTGHTITVKLNRRAYAPVLRSADLPADTTSPGGHAATPLRLRLTPGSIQLRGNRRYRARAPSCTRNSRRSGLCDWRCSGSGSRRRSSGCSPRTSLCAPSLETSSVQTSRRLPCRVLAGVTAGAAVSTYGV
jgi:hypothetical protein